MPTVYPTLSAVAATRWAALPVALLVSGLVIGQSSYAAFTASTSNPTNNWTTGTVVLSDDDSNTAMFTASALKPGSTGEKCILVTSTGTVPSAVKLYGTSPATTNGLNTHIDLIVQIGSGATSSSCTGFTSTATIHNGTLAAFGTAATSYATGLGTWAPTGSGTETRAYKFSYTVNAAAPNTTQNSTASIGLTWEAQTS